MADHSMPAAANAAIERLPLRITINGRTHELQVAPWTALLDLLREDLGLMGGKKRYDHGHCGSCTVLVGGQRMNSCLQLAVMRDGAEVTSIDRLAGPERRALMPPGRKITSRRKSAAASIRRPSRAATRTQP